MKFPKIKILNKDKKDLKAVVKEINRQDAEIKKQIKKNGG